MTEPKTIRNEIYDDNNLLRVEFIEVEEVIEENINTNTNKQNDIN
jgi:hypothetical protein